MDFASAARLIVMVRHPRDDNILEGSLSLIFRLPDASVTEAGTELGQTRGPLALMVRRRRRAEGVALLRGERRSTRKLWPRTVCRVGKPSDANA